MRFCPYFIIITLSLSSSAFAQNSYWKFQKVKPILKTALDMEFFMGLFSEDDYVDFNQTTNEAILYMFESDMEPFNLNEANREDVFKYKFKLVEGKLKILVRAGIDNIYFVLFEAQQMNREEFLKTIERLKG